MVKLALARVRQSVKFCAKKITNSLKKCDHTACIPPSLGEGSRIPNPSLEEAGFWSCTVLPFFALLAVFKAGGHIMIKECAA